MLRAVMDPNTKRIVYKDDGAQGMASALAMLSRTPAAGAPSMSIGGMAAPTPQSALGSHLSGLEQRYGLPQGYLAQIRAVESSNGKNLANPDSTARGPYQFIDQTARAVGLNDADRMDEFKSANAVAKMASADASAFQAKYGRAPTGAEVYGMHQRGRDGFFSLMGGTAATGAAADLNKAGGLSAEGQIGVIRNMYNNARPDLPGDPTTRYGAGFGRNASTADEANAPLPGAQGPTNQGATAATPTTPAAAPAVPAKYDGGIMGLFNSDNPGADAKSMLASGSGFMGAAKGLMGALGGSGGGQTVRAPGIQNLPEEDQWNKPNMSLLQMLYAKRGAPGGGAMGR